MCVYMYVYIYYVRLYIYIYIYMRVYMCGCLYMSVTEAFVMLWLLS